MQKLMFLSIALTCCLLVASSFADRLPQGGNPHSSYAVVISEETYAQKDWQAVAAALENKYDAHLIRYQEDLNSCLPALQDQFPRYACFVATPEEASRDYVARVHQLMRKLDDDPYTDLVWGIITGFDAGDALRLARHSKPLVARKVLTITVGSPMDTYDEGVMVDELVSNRMWVRTADGRVEQRQCPTDNTGLIADYLNDYQADVLITSGHATERDWNPGYGYRAGKFLCRDGRLYAKDLEGKEFNIDSANPKVHLAVGNCLISHIPDRQCMALALMRSASVHQMVGYTVTTWYGYGGWGVKDYFSELQAGRFTLAEANYVNSLALVYELQKQGGKHRGLLNDRDTVVLYGDPAWQARMPERELPWSQELTVKDGVYTFRITGNVKGDWDNRPIIELLPHRIRDVEILKGQDLQPVIADNFILVPLHKGLEPMKGNKGETFPIQGDYLPAQVFEVKFKATAQL